MTTMLAIAIALLAFGLVAALFFLATRWKWRAMRTQMHTSNVEEMSQFAALASQAGNDTHDHQDNHASTHHAHAVSCDAHDSGTSTNHCSSFDVSNHDSGFSGHH